MDVNQNHLNCSQCSVKCLLVSELIHTVFTQCSDCGVKPQMRGQTPPFAPQCKHKSPAPIAGSDPPFVLLQSCRVQPRIQGLTTLFCVCKQKAGSAPPPPNVWNFSMCSKRNFLLELVRSAPLVGSIAWVGSLCKHGSMKPPPPPPPPARRIWPTFRVRGIRALCKRGNIVIRMIPWIQSFLNTSSFKSLKLTKQNIFFRVGWLWQSYKKVLFQTSLKVRLRF